VETRKQPIKNNMQAHAGGSYITIIPAAWKVKIRRTAVGEQSQ
jgi:hypothetical protein